MDELQNVLKNYRLLTPDASGRHPSAMLADTIRAATQTSSMHRSHPRSTDRHVRWYARRYPSLRPL